jgi:hypothetical protein
VISQNKDAVLRDLVGKLDITFSQSFFRNIGFIKRDIVDGNISLFINIDPVPCTRDIALDENTVIVIKGDDISLLKVSALV